MQVASSRAGRRGSDSARRGGGEAGRRWLLSVQADGRQRSADSRNAFSLADQNKIVALFEDLLLNKKWLRRFLLFVEESPLVRNSFLIKEKRFVQLSQNFERYLKFEPFVVLFVAAFWEFFGQAENLSGFVARYKLDGCFLSRHFDQLKKNSNNFNAEILQKNSEDNFCFTEKNHKKNDEKNKTGFSQKQAKKVPAAQTKEKSVSNKSSKSSTQIPTKNNKGIYIKETIYLKNPSKNSRQNSVKNPGEKSVENSIEEIELKKPVDHKEELYKQINSLKEHARKQSAAQNNQKTNSKALTNKKLSTLIEESENIRQSNGASLIQDFNPNNKFFSPENKETKPQIPIENHPADLNKTCGESEEKLSDSFVQQENSIREKVVSELSGQGKIKDFSSQNLNENCNSLLCNSIYKDCICKNSPNCSSKKKLNSVFPDINFDPQIFATPENQNRFLAFEPPISDVKIHPQKPKLSSNKPETNHQNNFCIKSPECNFDSPVVEPESPRNHSNGKRNKTDESPCLSLKNNVSKKLEYSSDSEDSIDNEELRKHKNLFDSEAKRINYQENSNGKTSKNSKAKLNELGEFLAPQLPVLPLEDSLRPVKRLRPRQPDQNNSELNTPDRGNSNFKYQNSAVQSTSKHLWSNPSKQSHNRHQNLLNNQSSASTTRTFDPSLQRSALTAEVDSIVEPNFEGKGNFAIVKLTDRGKLRYQARVAASPLRHFDTHTTSQLKEEFKSAEKSYKGLGYIPVDDKVIEAIKKAERQQ